MAQIINSGNVYGAKGHHWFRLKVNEDSTSSANNTSSLSFTFELGTSGGGWDWSGWGSKISYSVTVAGNTYKGTIPSYDGSSTVTLKSASGIIVEHDSTTGEKTISASFTVTDDAEQRYTCGDVSEKKYSAALTKLPRYANVTHSIITYEERYIKIEYKTDATCSKIEYTIDGGSTYYVHKSSNTAAGTYIIELNSGTSPAINAGTYYKIQIRTTHGASGLTATSTATETTTHRYAYVVSVGTPQYYIGTTKNIVVNIDNPLSRNITVYMKASNGTIVGSVSTTNKTSATITSIDNAKLYQSIPNTTSGTATFYTSSATGTTKTGTYYTQEAFAKPTFNPTITYRDSFTGYHATIASKKSSTILVQNMGKLTFKISALATSPSYAGSITYKASFPGATDINIAAANTEYTFANNGFNIAGSAKLTVTATDSRGYKTSKDVTIQFYPRINPSLSVNAYRKNNYEAECYIETSASYGATAAGNGQKSLTYLVKNSAGTTIVAATNITASPQKISSNLDNTQVYSVTVSVTDLLDMKNSVTVTIGKGVPILFIDTGKLGVGVNTFPSGEGLYCDKLYVNNNAYITYDADDQAISFKFLG